MTKKEWNKLKLQIVLRKKPKETFIIAIRDYDRKFYCGGCKNNINIEENDVNLDKCEKCQPKFIETIDKKGMVKRHVYMTGYYPRKFDD